MKTIINITITLFFGFFGNAQQAIVSVGGNSSGAGGSFSYSVGQLDYTATTTTNGSLEQGVQHLYINGLKINLKLFIEGYYDGFNTMRSVKNNQDSVSPLTDVADIVVELRDTANASQVIASSNAILKTNGDAFCHFPAVNYGNYYIAVKGNNTITTYSANPVLLGVNPLNYDFTDSSDKAFGYNMARVEEGVYAIFSGDLNADGNIDNTDYSLWETDANNFEFGLFPTDLNGDGNVDNSDYSIWEANANNFIYAIAP